MASDDVQAVGRRIDLIGPPPGQDRFAATIEIDARGTTFRAFQDRNVRGRYENPMTDDEVRAKARELMQPVLGKDRVDAVIACVERIESLDDVFPLLNALTPATLDLARAAARAHA